MEAGRHADRQIERETDRRTDRQTDRIKERKKESAFAGRGFDFDDDVSRCQRIPSHGPRASG